MFTTDPNKSIYAENMDVGGVGVGDVPPMRVDAQPQRRRQGSGIGREGIRYAIEDMTEMRGAAQERRRAAVRLAGRATRAGALAAVRLWRGPRTIVKDIRHQVQTAAARQSANFLERRPMALRLTSSAGSRCADERAAQPAAMSTAVPGGGGGGGGSRAAVLGQRVLAASSRPRGPAERLASTGSRLGDGPRW